MRIASPPPMGTGIEVESLTSYIRRLACVHRVPVPLFLNVTVIEPLRRERGQRDPMIQPTRATESIGGVGTVTAALVARLEQVTGREGVRALTWLGRDNGICLREAFRARRAWCVECLRTLDRPAYDRLIWTLRDLGLCPAHHIALAEACGSCGAEQPPLATWAHPTRCCRCGTPLISAHPRRLNSSESRRTPLVVSTVTELIRGTLVPDHIRVTVAAELERAGSLRALARGTGVSPAELIALRDGAVRPHLATYIDLLTRTMAPKRIRPTPVDEVRTRRVLATAAKGPAVPSVRALARELGTSPATLRSRWPDLSTRILVARHEQIRRRAAQSQAARRAAIQTAVARAARAGGVGRRAVERLLPRPGIFRAFWAREAFRAETGRPPHISR